MNKITILNNKKCHLELDDKEIVRSIKSELQYEQEGYIFSFQHKEFGWDGMTCVMSPTNKFNYPLLQRVKILLEKNNVTYTIDDKRIARVEQAPLDISQRLKDIGMIPRDYQQQVIDVISDKDNNVGIFRLCTGAGKTLVCALATAHINKPTMIFVIGVDLLYQFHELFSKIFDEPIGIIGDGVCTIGKRINIATIQTVGKVLKMKKSEMTSDDTEMQDEKFDESNSVQILNALTSSKVFFLDECHCAGNRTLKNIYKAINPEHFYGLSGTPFKGAEDNLEIINFLGEKLMDVSATNLISRKILPQPIIKIINAPSFIGFSKTYHEVYREGIVDNDLRNSSIMNNVKDLISKKYKVLALFKTVDHGKILLKLFKENGLRCSLLSGKDSIEKRNKAKEDITNGKIDVIIASVIFDLGVDIPALSGLLLCGSGKSFIRANQRIGRLLRPYPGKTNVAIVDYYDNVRYLKGHSKKRIETYKLESGFKLILPKNLK